MPRPKTNPSFIFDDERRKKILLRYLDGRLNEAQLSHLDPERLNMLVQPLDRMVALVDEYQQFTQSRIQSIRDWQPPSGNVATPHSLQAFFNERTVDFSQSVMPVHAAIIEALQSAFPKVMARPKTGPNPWDWLKDNIPSELVLGQLATCTTNIKQR